RREVARQRHVEAGGCALRVGQGQREGTQDVAAGGQGEDDGRAERGAGGRPVAARRRVGQGQVGQHHLAAAGEHTLNGGPQLIARRLGRLQGGGLHAHLRRVGPGQLRL